MIFLFFLGCSTPTVNETIVNPPPNKQVAYGDVKIEDTGEPEYPSTQGGSYEDYRHKKLNEARIRISPSTYLPKEPRPPVPKTDVYTGTMTPEMIATQNYYVKPDVVGGEITIIKTRKEK